MFKLLKRYFGWGDTFRATIATSSSFRKCSNAFCRERVSIRLNIIWTFHDARTTCVCIACEQIPISNCTISSMEGMQSSRGPTKCIFCFCANATSNEYWNEIAFDTFHSRFVACDALSEADTLGSRTRIVTGSWIIVAACKRFFLTLSSVYLSFSRDRPSSICMFCLVLLPDDSTSTRRPTRQNKRWQNKFAYNIQICLGKIATGPWYYMKMGCCAISWKCEGKALGNIFTFNVNAAQNGNGACRLGRRRMDLVGGARAKNVLVYYEFSKCKWNDILSVRLYPLSFRSPSHSIAVKSEPRRRRKWKKRIQCSGASCDCYLAWKSISNVFDDDDIRLLDDVGTSLHVRSFDGARRNTFHFVRHWMLLCIWCVCVFNVHLSFRFRRFFSASPSVSASPLFPSMPCTVHTNTAHT